MSGIQHVALDQLRENPDNPRVITTDMEAALATALERHPQLLQARPLIARPDGTVIAGNQRLKQLRKQGATHAPVYYADVDDTALQEWLVIDNNGFGEWVIDPLQRLLNDLHDADVPLDALGFKPDELAEIIDGTNAGDLLGPPDNAGTDTDPGPRPEHATTRPGDVIQLGEHLLICGDAALADTYVLPGTGEPAGVDFDIPFRFALVIADPPYGVDYTGSDATAPRGGKPRKRLTGDEDTAAYKDALPMIVAHANPDAPIYLWIADRQAGHVHDVIRANGLEVRAQIIWYKTNGQYPPSRAHYKSKHESLLYLARPKAKVPWHGANNEPTVWEHPQAASNADHPTQKPVEVYERIIANSTEPGGLVLDPFAGSGTTILAADNLGRRAVCIEIDPGYCDVIVDRWERHTGQEAQRP